MYIVKFIIVIAVGKSNILLQFSQKKFKTDHEITIGVEFGAKNISIGDDKLYRIQIWDTVILIIFKKNYHRLVRKHLNQLQELIIKTVYAPF